jgi:hypothetical protein
MVEIFDPHPILVNVNKFTNSLWFPEDGNQGYKGGGAMSMNNRNGMKTTNWKWETINNQK